MEDASPRKKWEQRWGSPVSPKGLVSLLPLPPPSCCLPQHCADSFLWAAGKGWSGQVDVCVFVGAWGGRGWGWWCLYSSGRMGGRLSLHEGSGL